MARRRRIHASDLPEAVEREVSHLSKLTATLGDVLERRLESIIESDDELSMPDADWVRAYRAYEQSVSALMQERRKNAALMAGANPTGGEPPISDAEYQATLDALVERRIGQLDEAQLGRLMLDRMNQGTKT